MAYGEKYHAVYCDRNRRQYRLSIHEWNYQGPSTLHKPSPSPFTLTQETSSELKVGGIFPTRATVTLVSSKTFNMEDLYTADERKYMVSHEPTDGSDEGKWYGHVIPNGFTEEMDNDVHYMVLTASDNLPTLQLTLFEESPGVNYGGSGSLIEGEFVQSFLWVAKEALKKTGFSLPVRTMVDVKPLLSGDGGTFAENITVEADNRFIFHNYQTSSYIDPSYLVPGNTIVISGSDHEQNNRSFVIDEAVNYSSTGWRITLLTSGLYYDTFNYMDYITMQIIPPSDISTLPDPLAITVHDLRTYIRDQDLEGKNYYEISGSALSTWDVLNNLAKQWNAKIYQNNGRWEIVRWNAHMVPSGQYQYFVYNSEGTLTGRSPFGIDVDFACKSIRQVFRPFGHAISMDRVLGVVGVNYRFKFKTDGDSLVNLIQNGNFASIIEPGAPPPDTNPATFTPARWDRKISVPNPIGELLIVQVLSPNPGETFAPGIGSFLKITGRPNNHRFLSSDTGYQTAVNSGDELRIRWWQRVTWWNPGAGRAYRYVVVRIMVVASDGQVYCLVNGGPTSYAPAGAFATNTPKEVLSSWHKVENNKYPCFISNAYGSASSPDPLSPWVQNNIATPSCPISGRIVVEIVGAGAATALGSEPNRVANYFDAYFPGTNGMELRLWGTSNTEIHLTGFFIAKIVDPSNDKVAQIHPYWYENDGEYTDSIDDIEVMTGDDNNPDHVGNIYVMDGPTRKPIKSWDSWAVDFGWGALGLITAKSIMQQYYRPWRIIDGDYVAPAIDWSTRISFEERPGERYALLRGTIDYKNNRFSGTIVQVYDQATQGLPPGGIDGGGTVDPNWQPNGVTRCARDEDGLNTGMVERLEIDVNPSSQTNGQSRWVNAGENAEQCPIGDPIELLWGEQLALDIDSLRYYPLEKDGDSYTVAYSNDGSDNYLRLLHRADIGTVQSILYDGNYESISGWVYEPDVVINGYTYKHMRLTWFTGVYTDLRVIFKIN